MEELLPESSGQQQCREVLLCRIRALEEALIAARVWVGHASKEMVKIDAVIPPDAKELLRRKNYFRDEGGSGGGSWRTLDDY